MASLPASSLESVIENALANLDDAITAWEQFPSDQSHQTMDQAIDQGIRQLTKLANQLIEK